MLPKNWIVIKDKLINLDNIAFFGKTEEGNISLNFLGGQAIEIDISIEDFSLLMHRHYTGVSIDDNNTFGEQVFG